MLNVFHILGDTWAIETELAYLPFYKLNDRDIVLLDAGYAPTDREELTETLAKVPSWREVCRQREEEQKRNGGMA